MPRASPWIALKDLLPQGVPEALGDTKNTLSKGKLMFPACRRGTQRSSGHRKECSRPTRGSIRRSPRHFPGQSTTGQRGKFETMRNSEIVGPSMNNEEKGVIKPRQGLLGQTPPSCRGKCAPNAESAQKPNHF